MSLTITVGDQEYIHMSYMKLANRNSKRRGETIKNLKEQNAELLALVEALTAENERAKDALRPFADFAVTELSDDDHAHQQIAGSEWSKSKLYAVDVRQAAACLGYDVGDLLEDYNE